MAKQISRLKVLLSSPGNMNEERKIVEKVVSEINLDRGSREGFYVELITWETHTWPAAGTYAQGVINQQFPDDVDIYLGLMGAYFGTPTKDWGSGTEEEFRIAFESWKSKKSPQIMFYFSDAAQNLNQIDPEQLLKRNAFQKEIGELGVKYETYGDSTKLHVVMRRHLSRAIDDAMMENSGELVSASVASSTLNVFANFHALISSDPVIAADDLATKAALDLKLHNGSLNRLSKGVTILGKTTQRSFKSISRAEIGSASLSRKLQVFEKEVSSIYRSFSEYQRILVNEIPVLESSLGGALSNLQRVVEIIRKEALEETMPLEAAMEPMKGLLVTYKECKEMILNSNAQFAEADLVTADLNLQRMRIAALHNDLDCYFSRSIALMEDVISFYEK